MSEWSHYTASNKRSFARTIVEPLSDRCLTLAIIDGDSIIGEPNVLNRLLYRHELTWK
jgi:hypothetical protein